MAIDSIKSLSQAGSLQANKLPSTEKPALSNPLLGAGISIIGLGRVNHQPAHQVGQNFNMLF